MSAEKNKIQNSDCRINLQCVSGVCVWVYVKERGGSICTYLLGDTVHIWGRHRPWWQRLFGRVGVGWVWQVRGGRELTFHSSSFCPVGNLLFGFGFACLLQNILAMFERSETPVLVSEIFPEALG